MYLYCLIIGLSLLMISFFLDSISDIFQGLSLFDIHFDYMPGILPLSPLQICAFLVGFGGIGVTFNHLLPALLFGFLLSYLTHYILTKLKKINHETLTIFDLIGCEGKVITTIFENSIGNVSIDTKNGKITYPAKSSHTISGGTIVKIIDVDRQTLIVTDDSNYFLNSKNEYLS